MHMSALDRENYDYFELHYRYTTAEHYTVAVGDGKDAMSLTLTREPYAVPRVMENTDTLYQDYWTDAEAYAVCGKSGEVLGYVEFAPEEWNSRLRMTQLLVLPEYRGTGAGKFMVNFVKQTAAERGYRVIVLEAQNYNVPAIDFYRSQGFRFCGGNVYFYSNSDVEDDEVMLEMAYLVE